MKNSFYPILTARSWLLGVGASLASVLGAQAQTCSGTDPGGAAATNGLYAEYYSGYYNDDQAYFGNNTRKLARIDSAANFQTSSSFGDLVGAGVTTSGTAANPELFSARYRGSFYAQTSTTYTFYLNSDDASAMWVDNDALTAPPLISRAAINNSGLHSAATVQASIYLEAGFHNLLIHYGENTGGNVLTLQFSTAAISRRYVPRRLLCTSVQPLAYAPTALSYAPRLVTVLSGTAGNSPLPTLTRDAADVAPAQYSLNAPPAGISIDPTTGVIAAAPGTAIGTYTLSVRVTTGSGRSFLNVFTFSVVANPNTACAGTNPGGGPASNGLYAKYYPGYFNDVQSFFSSTTPGLERIDSQLNYGTTGGWGVLTPPASGADTNPDAYSARYQGALLITTGGTYTLSLTSDDASYLWLDNASRRTTLVSSEATINNGGLHGSRTVSTTVALAAGKHDLVVHFGENGGDNILTLAYSGPDTGNASTTVPATALCSSTTGLPLPVVLTRFSAEPVAGGVALAWHTAQEVNSAYFAVERSADGRAFAEVARAAAAGSTTAPQAYSVLDRAPLPGLAYYRLRQVDIDGTTTYSPVVAFTVIGAAANRLAAQVLPNPAASGSTPSLRVQQAAALPLELTIADLQGRLLHRQALPAAQAFDLPLPALRAPGVYLLRVASASGSAVQKLVVQ